MKLLVVFRTVTNTLIKKVKVSTQEAEVAQRVPGRLTLNLLTTIIVAPPSNASKWQMGFNP